MITYVSNLCMNYLVKHKVVFPENTTEYNWLKYGIEITLSTVLGYALIFIIAVITGTLFQGAIYLFVFTTLRQYSGGYHSATYAKCNLTFVSCFLVYLLLLHMFPKGLYEIHLAIGIIELLLAIYIFPIENKNKPFKTKTHYKKCRIISLILTFSYISIGIFFNMKSIPIGTMIIYTIHLIMILGLIGYLKERRRHNEKK